MIVRKYNTNVMLRYCLKGIPVEVNMAARKYRSRKTGDEMRKNDSFWLEFKGQNSSALGVVLMDAHGFSTGAARGARELVSGRDGYVWLSDEAKEALDIRRVCRAPGSKLREVTAWLSGSGALRFSNEPELAYDARVIQGIDPRRVIGGADPLYEFAVTFSCQPFPRAYPAPADILITSSGTPVTNPGTAPALPRVTVRGSGSFSLTIGKQTVLLRNISEGIILDSELMDALTLDGRSLANDKMDGDFFQIQPGDSYVQWLASIGDDTGKVTGVTISPRWRYL